GRKRLFVVAMIDPFQVAVFGLVAGPVGHLSRQNEGPGQTGHARPDFAVFSSLVASGWYGGPSLALRAGIADHTSPRRQRGDTVTTAPPDRGRPTGRGGRRRR